MRIFLSIITIMMSIFMIGLTFRSLFLKIKMDSFDLNTPKGRLDAMTWLSGGIDEIFEKVNLIVYSSYAENESVIYDFSKYEENNAVILFAAGPISRNDVGAYKNQTIYRFKDGSHLWAEGELM